MRLADGINYNSAVSDIEKGSIKGLYLFFGPENVLISDCISRIEKKIINPAFRSLNFIKIDGADLTLDGLVNACETLPFMDERKMVVVYDCPFFKSKKSAGDNENDNSINEIIEYIGRIPDSTVLVLTWGGDIDKRKKIYNAVKKNGDIVECSFLKSQDLTRWIIDKFHENGKNIGNSDASYLAERISGNLEEVQNEVNKLCAYGADKKTIVRADIDAVVPKSLEMNIFQLVDSVAQKNPGQALRILNELVLNSEPIPIILTMIIRQYRLMLNSKLLSEKGYSASEIARKLSLNPYVASKLLQLSGKYTEDAMEERLKSCLDADESIKMGRMDQRIALETLIVEFAR